MTINNKTTYRKDSSSIENLQIPVLDRRTLNFTIHRLLIRELKNKILENSRVPKSSLNV